jgi:phage tail sheath protein FI
MRTLHTPGVSFEWLDAAPPLMGPLRTDVAAILGIAERGPLHTPTKIESRNQFASVFGAKIAQGYLAYAIDGFFANGGVTCWVVRVADPISAGVASLDILDDSGAKLLGVTAGSPGSWGNRTLARWIYRGSDIVSLTLHYPDGTEQLIRSPVSVALPPVPNEIQIERVSLPATLLAPLVVLTTPDRGSASANGVPIFAGEALLAGGSDGLAALTVQHFSGDGAPADAKWGLAALEQVAEVSVVAMPDIMPKLRLEARSAPPLPYNCRNLDQSAPPPPVPPAPIEFPPAFTDLEIYSLQEALIRHCEKVRYRVAVLDTKDGLLPEAAVATRRGFAFTDRASLYYPWIFVDDPLLLDGIVRAVPPSGAVAGVYARGDNQFGVQKPPANEVLEGALDVGFMVDPIVHGELNDEHVNVIRSFPGRGIRVYGARTVSENPLWMYVNVRRLVLMIEKAIELNSQWMVFEPNNTLLRGEMDRVIRTYLESLFRAGTLDGTSSDDAYFVKCDDAVNPPEEQDAGRVICQIGVQPPYPAEFVVILIGKTQNAVEIIKESGALNG